MIDEKSIRVVAKIMNAAETGRGCEISHEEAKSFMNLAMKFPSVVESMKTDFSSEDSEQEFINRFEVIMADIINAN